MKEKLLEQQRKINKVTITVRDFISQSPYLIENVDRKLVKIWKT